MVSRTNLRFDGESVEEFERKLEIAQHYRELSEIYLKYNYIIDCMDTPTH